MLSIVQKIYLTSAYFVYDHEDPHAEFARLAGITRDEAKRLYFQFMFGAPAMRRHNNSVRAATYNAVAEHSANMERRFTNFRITPPTTPQPVANPLVEDEDAW